MGGSADSRWNYFYFYSRHKIAAAVHLCFAKNCTSLPQAFQVSPVRPGKGGVLPPQNIYLHKELVRFTTQMPFAYHKPQISLQFLGKGESHSTWCELKTAQIHPSVIVSCAIKAKKWNIRIKTLETFPAESVRRHKLSSASSKQKSQPSHSRYYTNLSFHPLNSTSRPATGH